MLAEEAQRLFNGTSVCSASASQEQVWKWRAGWHRRPSASPASLCYDRGGNKRACVLHFCSRTGRLIVGENFPVEVIFQEKKNKNIL